MSEGAGIGGKVPSHSHLTVEMSVVFRASQPQVTLAELVSTTSIKVHDKKVIVGKKFWVQLSPVMGIGMLSQISTSIGTGATVGGGTGAKVGGGTGATVGSGTGATVGTGTGATVKGTGATVGSGTGATVGTGTGAAVGRPHTWGEPGLHKN